MGSNQERKNTCVLASSFLVTMRCNFLLVGSQWTSVIPSCFCTDDEMESVIFDQAMDGLPAELETFKDLFGPSFIRAIKMVLNNCASRLQQIDNTYKPVLDDMSKEYNEGVKTYGEVVDIDPKAAEQLQSEGLRKLKNLLDSANLAKNAESNK